MPSGHPDTGLKNGKSGSDVGAGGKLKHEKSPEARVYQRDALPVRVAFRPSLAFSGEVVESITAEFRNFQRWVPGQPPKSRRRKRKAARPEPVPERELKPR